MARYTGADCRRCRREKMKLFLKGSKCDGPKCPFESRPFPPGQHGRGRTKETEYLLQLREKQKARRIYGVLEKQFRGYYEEANRKPGKTGEVLLQILESRLDNVVYRAGLAKSRDHARQLVKHGHFLVNGKKVDIPSYRVTRARHRRGPGKSREMTPFVVAQAEAGSRDVPAWLETIPSQIKVLVHSLPARQVHRHPGPGAADRRALLASSQRSGGAGVGAAPAAVTTWRHIAGAPNEGESTVLITQRPTLTEESISETRSRFTIEPLEPGFGYTLGNSLRRTLLSSIPGAAVTSIKIDGVLHEFTTIPGVKEDVVELVMNVKELCVSVRARRAGQHVPAQAGPRRRDRRRHPASGRCLRAQPGPEARHPQRQGPARHGADGRAWPRLRHRRAEQERRRRDRPDPGRLDLLAGAQGDLPRRGDPCRAAHRLRPADHRRRVEGVHLAAYRAGVAPVPPWSSCSGSAASWTRPPRASTSARRRRTRSSLPTWRCRSRSWT